MRITTNGAKSFLFGAKLNGKAIGRTLRKFPLMKTADQAREIARVVKNNKQDSRELRTYP
jgi:hypothetical protein